MVRKYAKEQNECHAREGTMVNNIRSVKLETLMESHLLNEKWNESWILIKSPKLYLQPADHFENHNDQCKVPWFESWKYFKQELHTKANSRPARPASLTPDWEKSWSIYHPNSQYMQHENSLIKSESQTVMVAEPLNPEIYQTIIHVSGNIKNKIILVDAQVQMEKLLVKSNMEWQSSWLTTKNHSEYKEQPLMKPTEDKQNLAMKIKSASKQVAFEVMFFPKMCKPAEMLEPTKSKQKESLLSVCNDSWKSIKNQPKQNMTSRRCQKSQNLSQHSIMTGIIAGGLPISVLTRTVIFGNKVGLLLPKLWLSEWLSKMML